MRPSTEQPGTKITATELLLCLAIMSILGALLVPTFQQIRRNNLRIALITRKHLCASNEKQLGLALMQYSQDYDNCLPNISDAPGSANTWRQALHRYVRVADLYQCPARPHEVIGKDGYSQSYAANYISNGTDKDNKGLGAFAGPGSIPVTRADFFDPAHTIALLEAAQNPGPEFDIENPTAYRSGPQKLWAGHDGGSNYLLADGHIKWMRPLDTYQNDGNGAVIMNYWHRNPKTPLTLKGIAALKKAQMEFMQ